MECPRCGAIMGDEEKYCSKCGALNMNLEENKKYSKFDAGLNKKEVQERDMEYYRSKAENKFKKEKTNTIVMICVDALIFIIALIFMGTTLTFTNNLLNKNVPSAYGSITSILNISIGIVYIFSMFYLVCFQILLKKANLPWWGLFIPIYNIYLFYKLCTDRFDEFAAYIISDVLVFIGGYLSSMDLDPVGNVISIIGSIASIIVVIKAYISLGYRFKTSPILTVLFPGIMIPIMAFDKKRTPEI